MKLHLPKALAAAVMALFAVPNALADVTSNETSTLTKGVDYFLPSGSKGDIVLTLADGFSSVAAGTTLVTAKAEATGTQTMEIVTAGSGAFRGKANGGDYGTAGTKAPSGSSVTVRFDKDLGAFVYDGMTTTTELMNVSGLRYSATIGGAYSYSVAETDVITSATFADSSVGIIKNLSGSGALTSSKSFLIIEGGSDASSASGSEEINFNMSGKTLSIAGYVNLGNITSSGEGSGVYIAKGASLTAQNINCAWKPGTMVINGNLTVNELFNMAINDTTNIQGVGAMTVASLKLSNHTKMNTSLSNFNVSGDVMVGVSGSQNDALTISGGTFTVGGTTTVASGRNLTVSGGAATFTGATTINGILTVSGSGTASFGNLTIGSVVQNSGSISIREGATVSFSDGFISSTFVGDDVVNGNGFGALESLALNSVISGTVNIGNNITWKNGEDVLGYSDGILTFSSGHLSTIYQINDAGAEYNLDGATSVVIGATNGTVSLTGATSLDITVKQGAILDIKGNECEGCDLVLAGGTLKNSGAATDAHHQQFFSLTLTADSEIQVGADSNQYGIIRQGYGSTFIDIGGHTLTKTGDGNFFAATANLRGGGILKIQGGTFTIGLSEGGEKASIGNSSDTENTNIWFTGNGRLNSGKGIELNKDVEFLAKAEENSTAGVTGTISAALDLKNKTATFKAAAANDKLVISGLISDSTSDATKPKVSVTGSGTVEFAAGSGGGKVMNLTLSADSTLLCNAGADSVLQFNCTTSAKKLNVESGEVRYINPDAEQQHLGSSTVEIKKSATLNLLGSWKTHTYLGVLTGEGTLQTSCASTSGQTDGYRATVISDDASGFTGEWRLYTTGETDSNRRVRGVLNTGTFGGVVNFTGDNVVDTAVGSQLLLAMDSKVAGLEGTMKNAEVMGISADSVSNDKLMGKTSDVSGQGRALTITANKDCSYSGKVNANVSLVVGDGTNAASQTFDGATIGGSMELKDHATVTATGSTTIETLTGTGTLTASGGEYIQVKDASGFTGTLTATDAQINLGKASSLAAIHSSSALGVILSGSSSTVTVDEMVLAGTWVSVKYSKSEGVKPVEATVSTGSLTVSGTSTSTLGANLELKENSILKLDSALAMGSTLTLGSGITLSGSLLNTWQNDSITLFTGVDGFNGRTEATSVAASDFFSNAELANGAGGYNYKVLYGGGENAVVELVRTASDTPEPTTATLSLLALMGLAARRRRKAAK